MAEPASSPAPSSTPLRWYHGVTRYQWLVLIIASAGWIFDVYEGQVYNTTREDMLNELVVAESPEAKEQLKKQLGDVFLGIFLAGGMTGGLLFGMLGDRWGRKPTMIVTILMYSLFSGLTYFAQDLWQVGILRFLVSMGIGGEWAVAAAMVSEVFPVHARAGLEHLSRQQHARHLARRHRGNRRGNRVALCLPRRRIARTAYPLGPCEHQGTGSTREG
ncbi:MAG: MFS transporter [Pirellulales bacterium]